MNDKNKKEKIIVKTEAKFLPISPRKLRLIVEAVKKLPPEEAMKKLTFLDKKGATFLQKAIKTCLADAVHNFELDKGKLVFEEIIVNEGPMFKRRDKSKRMFRYGIIRKRRSHLIVKIREG